MAAAALGGTSAHPLLQLQQAAGNAAVAALVQRATIDTKAGTVNLKVGDDVPLPLAVKGQEVAKGGVTDAELRRLRAEALGDDTISDAERMFLAALLDAKNAAQVAKTPIAANTTFSFARDTVEPHMAHARDIDQAVKDPRIATERGKAAAAGTIGDLLEHTNAALRATFNQVAALTGPGWARKALDAIGFGLPAVPVEDVLDAMINAASDDTPGDRAMAAVVYVIAATAGHPMAPVVRAGRIKVDQLAQLGGELASYGTVGGQEGKGDTIKVPSALDPEDLGHRGIVIHELTHAAQDARAAGDKVQMSDREQAEIEAYRAGARYQLEELADALFSRGEGVRQVATVMSDPLMIALALEAQADPERFKPVVREINAQLRSPSPADDLERAMRAHHTQLTRLLQKAVQAHYHTQDAPGANDLPVDQHRGEGRFDWVDRL